MNLVKQGQTTDVQVGLRMMKDTEFAYGAKQIKHTIRTVVISNIFQSFVDPERPTEEEFVIFKLQYGVDWIVEPMK